eukprot:scaffold283316_cov44-Prasinocladus_malaysianus.AAC.1
MAASAKTSFLGPEPMLPGGWHPAQSRPRPSSTGPSPRYPTTAAPSAPPTAGSGCISPALPWAAHSPGPGSAGRSPPPQARGTSTTAGRSCRESAPRARGPLADRSD